MQQARAAIVPSTTARPLAGWLWIAAAALFGALAIEQALALLAGRPDLKTRLLAWATSDDFVFGKASLSYEVAWYQRAPVRMALHMGLGGVALGLGSLQFVPALRARFPRWHRAAGLAVWIATTASMVFAIAFLVFVPAARGASGVAFHAGLWSLALVTLLMLAQAVLAAWSRDFRSHMIWMALVYAGLLTAPVLRVDWVALAWLRPDVGHEWNNLATGVLVLPQTLLLMALWLDWIGDTNLRGRPAPTSAWPAWVVLAVCALSALAVVQEAFLGGTAADPFAAARGPLDRLPAARWLWGAASLAALALAPAAWRDGLAGRRPGRPFTIAAAGVAAGALLMGLAAEQSSIGRLATASFFVAYAVLLALALLLAWVRGPNSVGRNAWLLMALGALWLPSQIDGLLWACLRIPGGSFSEAYAAALAIGIGGVLTVGVATGYGARFRLRAQRRGTVTSA
jgi:hypothetical protein